MCLKSIYLSVYLSLIYFLPVCLYLPIFDLFVPRPIYGSSVFLSLSLQLQSLSIFSLSIFDLSLYLHYVFFSNFFFFFFFVFLQVDIQLKCFIWLRSSINKFFSSSFYSRLLIRRAFFNSLLLLSLLLSEIKSRRRSV